MLNVGRNVAPQNVTCNNEFVLLKCQEITATKSLHHMRCKRIASAHAIVSVDVVCCIYGDDVLVDKTHAATHASVGNSASAKQPRLMTRNREFSDGHSVNDDANSCVLMSPFDHELGQVVNNSPAVLNKVASLCENDSLSDIELIVCCNDGDVTRRSFPAHKLILSCSSDVLRVMLMNPCWPDSSRHTIELHEEQSCVPVCYSVMLFLAFL